MSERTAITSKPSIIISDIDQMRLSALAARASSAFQDVADELQAEIDRARIVNVQAVPADVVQMGSTVRFRSDAGIRTVTLVFPGEADIAADKISILTPIGAALIGLTLGQSIEWTTRDGRTHELTVLSVVPPDRRAAQA